MELKQGTAKRQRDYKRLLIVPYGIETHERPASGS